MNEYDNKLKVKDALQIYFSKYHFANGGYDLKWFKIKLGSFYLPLPNTKGRIAAVKLHDIHHIITEYKATYQGEAEIAGWEIASGCGRFYAAWFLNAGSYFYGLFFFPKHLMYSFLRGRKVKSNLYHHTTYDEILLNKTVEEIRRQTEPDLECKNTTWDYFAFTSYSLVILTLYFFYFFLFYCFLRLFF